jgi:hypothetical protein
MSILRKFLELDWLIFWQVQESVMHVHKYNLKFVLPAKKGGPNSK